MKKLFLLLTLCYCLMSNCISCRRQHLWLYALSSTLAISFAPFVILFFISVDNSEENHGRLKVLLG